MGYWNAFFNAVLYINTPEMLPLQVVLRSFVLQGIGEEVLFRGYVLQSLSSKGTALTEQGVRELLGQELPDPSEATVRYIQAASSQQQLDQAAVQQIQQTMAAADIEVNPRYGEFEPGQGLVPPQENWILSATPQANPTP